MNAKVTWNNRLSFAGTADSGFTLPLDASPDAGGQDQGFRPMELLLVGLAGCTAMDVVSILQKKKQVITGFEVMTSGERSSDHPRVFTLITIEYVISGFNIDPAAVERAIELSVTKYCPAQAMLGKAVKIEHHYKLVNLEAA